MTYKNAKHPKQEDFIMVFSDEIGVSREGEEMDRFVDGLRKLAAAHGFDVSMWGAGSQMRAAIGGTRAREALEDALESLKDEDGGGKQDEEGTGTG